MKWTVPAVLLLAVALLAANAEASKPFQPSFNISSISNSTVGGHGNVVQQIAIAPGDHVPGFLQYTLPAGWDIAKVQSGTDEPIVGSGRLALDVAQSGTCGGPLEEYNLTIIDVGTEQDPPVETEWQVQGYPFETSTFVVKNSGGVQVIEAFLFVSPTPEVCTPVSWVNFTFQGVSSDNPGTPGDEFGLNVLTNPGSPGVYTWSVQFKSKPLDANTHIVNRCDQVGIGGAPVSDPDGDEIAGTCDNCPANANSDQRDDDLDGTGNPCDADDDNDGVCDPGASGPPCTGSDACPNTPITTPITPVDTIGCSQAQVDPDFDGVCSPGAPSQTTWCTGSDNCIYDANPGQADWNSNGIGDACDDSDGDGWSDEADNCRTVLNWFQENFDGDALGDACDADDDNDTWTDIQEEGNPPGTGLFIGTGAKKPCAFTTTANDEADDGLPADFNDDRLIDITDIGEEAGRFGSSQGGPGYLPRFDLNVDTNIDITDLGLVAGRFGQSC